MHPGNDPLVPEGHSGTSLAGRPSPEAMAMVQQSCSVVADEPVRLAEAFYRHLFAMAPRLRPMFADDLTEQMQRMTDTLLAAIAKLATADTSELEVVLFNMGSSHYLRHRVEPEHYVYIAHALTRAVRDITGWQYTSRLSSSWVWVCMWVTTRMCAGARAAMQAPPQPGTAPRPTPRAGTPAAGAASPVQANGAVPDPRPASDDARHTPSHRKQRLGKLLRS